jgi:hypothetical protein
MSPTHWILLILGTLAASAAQRFSCPPRTSLVSLYASNHNDLRCVHLQHCSGECPSQWVLDYHTCICIQMLPCTGHGTRIKRFNGDGYEVACVNG